MITLRKLILWSAGTLVLTIVHHIWGAIIYESSFRLHAAIVAIPLILIVITSYLGFTKSRNKTLKNICLTIFLVITLIFSVLAIGMYEGGYNHVLKNILYFSGVSTKILDRMYPSIYELPNDFIFELTGMAQLFTGIMTAIELRRLSPRRIFSR